MANCWETDTKWQQKTEVLGVLKQRLSQRTKEGQIFPQRHRNGTKEANCTTKYAEQHQVIRPFLHMSISPPWDVIARVRAPEKSRRNSENQYTSVVEQAWSKYLIATYNTSIRNSREVQCPSQQELVKLYILTTKAFPLYCPEKWGTRRFQPTFLNVEALNLMSKNLAGMLESVSVFPRCFMSLLLLTE